ncbi:MAG: FHA domain-containing protein [Candidatus Promineifilaceae bacterium]
MLYRRTICYIVLLCLLLPSVASAQIEEVEAIRIVSIDNSKFPDMSIQFTATNSYNVNILDLTSDDLMVFEDDQPVDNISLTDGDWLNDYTIIVLDVGEYSNLQEFDTNILRRHLNTFVENGRFQNGKDGIALYATNPDYTHNTQEIVPFTNSAAAYQNIVNQLTFDFAGYSSSMATVKYAHETLLNTAESDTTNLSVIYLGNFFELMDASGAELDQVITDFQESRTLFYGLHTSPSDSGSVVEMFASNTGGMYSAFFPGEESNEHFDTFAADIEWQDHTYQLNYRSKNASSGARNISVATSGDTLRTTKNLTISIQNPEIAITSPLGNTRFTRTLEKQDENVYMYSLDSFPVEARVEGWPDGYPRQIKSAELFVDGVSIERIDNPQTDKFTFDVDVRDYTVNTTVPIIFRIRDELGQTVDSPPINVSIDVVKDNLIEEAVATETNTPPTAVPNTPTSVAVATQTSTPSAVALVVDQNNTENAVVESASFAWLPYTAIGVLPLLLAGGFFYYRHTTQGPKRLAPPLSTGTRETMMVGGFSQINKTTMADDIGRTPLATLVILTAKADRVHQTYAIFNDLTVLGRDPEYTDLQLYDADDRSTVSGRHCTIQYQKSSKKFMLSDHSTSGTRVNNQLLERDRPVELVDGAEIMLGLVAEKGAKVRFELPTQDAVSSATMLDFDLQEQETHATVFDDFGTVTQLGSDELDDVFESSSPSNEHATNKDWMQGLE